MNDSLFFFLFPPFLSSLVPFFLLVSSSHALIMFIFRSVILSRDIHIYLCFFRSVILSRATTSTSTPWTAVTVTLCTATPELLTPPPPELLNHHRRNSLHHHRWNSLHHHRRNSLHRHLQLIPSHRRNSL